jgi:hypothetical protein
MDQQMLARFFLIELSHVIVTSIALAEGSADLQRGLLISFFRQ